MRANGFALIVLVVSGCSVPDHGNGGPPYGLQFVNFTDQDVKDVGYSYPGGRELGRRVQRRNFATTFPGHRPIPEVVTFSWTTVDGQHHEQDVAVASKVSRPSRFDGTIIFEIRASGVTVLALSYEQLVSYDENKSPRPLPGPAESTRPATMPSHSTLP
jgi:hypothetical protein